MQTTNEPMGSYYERPVLFQTADGFDTIAMAKMDHAVVLLWMGDRDWDPEALERAVGRFLERGTLHLTLAGERAGESFAVLMEAVSELCGHFITVLNVMSGLGLADAVEEFLKTAVPAESQMKSWKEYRIVLAGGSDELAVTMHEAIRACIGVRA